MGGHPASLPPCPGAHAGSGPAVKQAFEGFLRPPETGQNQRYSAGVAIGRGGNADARPSGGGGVQLPFAGAESASVVSHAAGHQPHFERGAAWFVSVPHGIHDPGRGRVTPGYRLGGRGGGAGWHGTAHTRQRPGVACYQFHGGCAAAVGGAGKSDDGRDGAVGEALEAGAAGALGRTRRMVRLSSGHTVRLCHVGGKRPLRRRGANEASHHGICGARQKLGVFADMAKRELLNPGMDPVQLQQLPRLVVLRKKHFLRCRP